MNTETKLELAKELKNAGFPQSAGLGRETTFFKPSYVKGEAYNKEVVDDLFIRDPSLSDLIEACEGKRFHLMKDEISGNDLWFAYNEEITCKGSTPEEVVAHLYLALNKK